MFRLNICLLLVGAAAMRSFEEFELAFGKKYSSRERFVRRAHFERSLQRVAAHNAGDHSWKAGINQFSDLSDEEFRSKVLMRPQKCSATNTVGVPGETTNLRGASDNKKKAADLPPSLDWRSRGIVSEVKNQGGCGSCWTFSTTGALESHLALKAGAWRAPRLSEQQLVDCAGAFDTKGCDGGLPSHAFEYIKHAGGLSTEFSYPYHAKDQKCSFNASASVTAPQSNGIGIRVPGGSVNLTKGDEGALIYYLATRGPISVAFDVASDFRDYKSGVYSSTVCSQDAEHVNHAVLAVGYGTDPVSGKPYWLIKNSWDYTWGDSGYFRMEAFKNMCGVADCNSFPDLYGV